MNNELVYRIALTLVPHIGAVHAKLLLEHFGDAQEIFLAKKSALEKIEGIGTIRANQIAAFNQFKKAEEEILFLEKYKIKALFINDKTYPQRFLHCYDPPTLFYYRGEADLNSSRVLAIVGTRTNTEYGKQVTEQLVKALEPFGVLIVSGLAFGIDAIAHKSALRNGMATVGVVGHGLDTMYPPEHKALAKEMVNHGGILTEFTSGTKPDKHNFPIRNRIVAGISDATVLVETGIKGGSMITAEMANGYNRDVFAYPGRTIDIKSGGCNFLIRQNKAILLSEPQHLIDILGWDEKKKAPVKQQKELFIQLTPDEKKIVAILHEKDAVAIDEINFKSLLSTSAVAAAILNLELQGLVVCLPGKLYKLI